MFELERRHMLELPAGTVNTITPCAACKLLRRRCAKKCPFSPYFSAHQPQKFASVHKVFGASNVSKLLMDVPENKRAHAANILLVYEANVRVRDPVYGCMGVILALQHQVQSLQAELNAVRDEIIRHNYSETNHDHHSIPSPYQLAFFSIGPAVTTPPPAPPPPSSASKYTPPYTTANYRTISTDDNVLYFD